MGAGCGGGPVMRLRVMFRRAQWVGGRQQTQGEVLADRVTVSRGSELLVNVGAADLVMVTAGDLPSTYLDAVRAGLPNAHRPWTGEEEEALRGLWERGVPIGDMVPILGRRYKAIKARAQLLGLPRRERRG